MSDAAAETEKVVEPPVVEPPIVEPVHAEFISETPAEHVDDVTNGDSATEADGDAEPSPSDVGSSGHDATLKEVDNAPAVPQDEVKDAPDGKDESAAQKVNDDKGASEKEVGAAASAGDEKEVQKEGDAEPETSRKDENDAASAGEEDEGDDDAWKDNEGEAPAVKVADVIPPVQPPAEAPDVAEDVEVSDLEVAADPSEAPAPEVVDSEVVSKPDVPDLPDSSDPNDAAAPAEGVLSVVVGEIDTPTKPDLAPSSPGSPVSPGSPPVSPDHQRSTKLHGHHQTSMKLEDHIMCGLPGQKAHLDLTDALEIATARQPHDKDGPISLLTDLGQFSWPGQKKPKGATHPLDDCGLGVVLYFKTLKSMGILFCIISAITMPPLVLFIACRTLTPITSTYQLVANSQVLLSRTTIANIGQPEASCREAQDYDTFAFSCPVQSKIQSIIAYYGHPQGYCGCPYEYQTNSLNSCPGSSSSSGACVADSLGNILPCNEGYTRYGEACCSYTLDQSSKADLSFIDLAPNKTCNSLTANYIVQDYCKGQQKCQFVLDPFATYSISTSTVPSYLRSRVCTRFNSTTCETNLFYNGVFDSCHSGVNPTLLSEITNSRKLLSSPTKSPTATPTAAPSLYAPSPFRLVFEAVCIADTVHVGNTYFSPNELVKIGANLDAVGVVIFLAAVTWMLHEMIRETDEADSAECTASDYTVICHTIPEYESIEDLTKKLKDHFESVLLKRGRRSLNKMRDGGEIADVEAQKNEVDKDVKFTVADINYSTSAYKYITEAVNRGAAAEKVDRVVRKIAEVTERAKREGDKRFDVRKKRVDLVKQLKLALYEFEFYNDRCQAHKDDAQKGIHSAYITFATETGYLRCMQRYPNVGVITYLIQHERMRMKSESSGKAAKTVFIEESPDPEEIIWENVPVPWWSVLARVIITTVVTILFLGCSYSMIQEAKFLKSKFTQKSFSVPCDTFDVFVSKDPMLYKNKSINTITYEKVQWDHNPAYYNLTATDYGSFNYLNCYCQKILYDPYKKFGDYNGMLAYTFYDVSTNQDETWCKSLYSGAYISQAAGYVSTAIIVIVNLILATCLRAFTKFERHNNVTGEAISLATKLFIAQYINTAMLSLIISGDLSLAGGQDVYVSGLGLNNWIQFGFFTGSIQDYNTNWYSTVGASLTFTMCLFIVANQPMQYIQFAMYRLSILWDRRWSFKKTVSHQDVQIDLADLYTGPAFRIEEKYASILAIVFTDMTYSPAMPLFNVITAMNLLLIYFTERFLLLRFYSKPPKANSELPIFVMRLFYVCAFIHISNGLWMYGNTGFHDPDNSVKTVTDVYATKSNFTQENTLIIQTTHDWDLPINYRQRLGNSNTYFLLLLWVIVAAYFSVTLIRNFIFERLGLGLLLRYFGSRLEKRSGWAWLVVLLGTLEKDPEGNVAYFEAIPTKTMLSQLKTGAVSADIYFRYMVELDYRGDVDWRKELKREHIDWKAKLAESNIDWRTAFDNIEAIKLAEAEHDDEQADDEVEEGGEVEVEEGGEVEVEEGGEADDAAQGGSKGDKKKKSKPRRRSVHVRHVVDGKMQIVNEPTWAQTSAENDDAKIAVYCGVCNKCREDCSDPKCSKECRAGCEQRCRGCSQEKQATACPGCCGETEEEDAGEKERELGGLESFNMVTNESYRRNFGLHTEHMRRANAQDQVVAGEKKIRDVIVHNANLPNVEEEPWIKDLIESCAPERVGATQRLKAVGFFATLFAPATKKGADDSADDRNSSVIEMISGEARV